MVKKLLGGRSRQALLANVAVLNRGEDRILLEGTEFVKAAAVARLRLGVERRQSATPSLAHWRQIGIAIAVAAIAVEFFIDHGGERHGPWPRHGLRHNPIAHSREWSAIPLR